MSQDYVREKLRELRESRIENPRFDVPVLHMPKEEAEERAPRRRILEAVAPPRPRYPARCPRCASLDLDAERLSGGVRWYVCEACTYRHGREEVP